MCNVENKGKKQKQKKKTRDRRSKIRYIIRKGKKKGKDSFAV